MLYTGIMILSASFLSQDLFSQQPNGKSEEFKPGNYREELFILTDRDVYIPGEQVWLKVYKTNGLNHIPSDISKVVYLELLDKNKFPLKQLKVRTDVSSGSSGFILPGNLSSGNYVIRAYTGWMQNFSPDLFSYRCISVVNPFENIENLKLPSGDNMSVTPDAGIGSQSVNPVPDGDKDGINFTVSLNKPGYSPRELVNIEITAGDLAGHPVETDLSVSVVKTVLVYPTAIKGIIMTDPSGSNVPVRDHLAEIEGHLLSGNIQSKSTGEPLRNIELSLSYVGRVARCQFSRTDINGDFNFVMKESGVNEIVIQPLSPDITGYYVELKQPFSNTFSNYIPETFYLDSSRINEINDVIIAMQVNNIYEPFRQVMKAEPKPSLPDFYGKPENTIRMSDYIELTSLREVVKEIIPNVYTLKQNGKYDFKLINKFRGQPFENKPLVLVDGVPIYDFEKVLNINSKEIERSDIINTRYFYSENVFDGIVSFITKKGNLSAMEFDNSIFRQVYEACQEKVDFYSPDYGGDILKKSHIPDFRNTLYWRSDLTTAKDGKTEVEFYTSDETVEYTIVVDGISSDGKRGHSTAKFVVR
jgi:hypothetical protein